jgi:dUTP pyrophosphatase
LAGVIDSDYRGDIGVILYNTDKNIDFEIKKGDRIAQIIFEACYTVTLNETNALDNTSRESGGFGSTGV